MDEFDRTWKLIQQHLQAQIEGCEPRAISSGRTLFGIKSTAEQTIERIVHETEAEQKRRRQQRE